MKKFISLLFTLTLFASCKKTEKKINETSVNTEQTNINNEPPQLESIPLEKSDSNQTMEAPPIVDHFICYKNKKNPKMIIWISFTEKNKAIEVKYKGQKTSIPITFEKQETTEGGTHPTTTTFYKEIYEGNENGTYKLTHSGIWDYVEYTRGKDGKKFNFTIDHNANPYGKEPCF